MLHAVLQYRTTPTTSSGASNVSSFHNVQCLMLIDVNKVTQCFYCFYQFFDISNQNGHNMKIDIIPCFPRLQCAVSPQPISSPQLSAATTSSLPSQRSSSPVYVYNSSGGAQALLSKSCFINFFLETNTNYGITATNVQSQSKY